MLQNSNKLLTILLFISIYYTTIVYSAFDTRLQIEGDAVVRTNQSIRITNLEITNTENDAYEEYNSKYGKDTTSMYLILPASSSITYTVEITNKVSDSYLIDSIEEISNTNNNVGVDLSLNVNDIVNSNSTKTFTITITNETLSEQHETLVIEYGFKLNRFTVSFDANGGSVDTSSKTVSYGSNYGTLPTPTRPGYKFLGWHNESNKNIFSDDIVSSNRWSPNQNVIVTKVDDYIQIIYNQTTSTPGYIYNYPSDVLKNNKTYTASFSVRGVGTNKLYFGGDYITYGFWDDISTSDFQRYSVTFTYTERVRNFLLFCEDLYIAENPIGTGFQIKDFMVVEGIEPYYLTSSTTVVQTQNHTLKAMWVTTMENNIVEYDYTGSSQEFIAPKSGTYKVELWGGSGGYESSNYSYGGYVSGNINLVSGQILYAYVGRSGCNNRDVSFNGGGSGSSRTGYSGGGATDIRLVNGNWSNFESLKSRILIAGAGGGFENYVAGALGGPGGGLIGYIGNISVNSGNPNTIIVAQGGTQTSGGEKSYCTDYTYNNKSGSFGMGGNPSTTGWGSGGGGGYYGGGAGSDGASVTSSGAGGSSFISGYSGCDAIDKDSTSDNIIHTGQANHYSGKVFTNAVMIDGAGCDWSTGTATNCGANQPQPDGTTATGHTGNGFARITFIE